VARGSSSDRHRPVPQGDKSLQTSERQLEILIFPASAARHSDVDAATGTEFAPLAAELGISRGFSSRRQDGARRRGEAEGRGGSTGAT